MKTVCIAFVAALCLGLAPARSQSNFNLAPYAKASASFVSGHETIAALNDGATPRHSNDKSHGAYGNWPQSGTQWVQYEWPKAVSINKVDVYWFDDRQGVRLPAACRLEYWDSDARAFKPVPNASGLGLAAGQFNTTTFSEVATSKLRLEMDSSDSNSTGVLEWRVYGSGKSPNLPPLVDAGRDRSVVMPGKTWLAGTVRDDGKLAPARVEWRKSSGPGKVAFENATNSATAATFSKPGDYTLALAVNDGEFESKSALKVSVNPAVDAPPLEDVAPRPYTLNSPFWNHRIKNQIIHWIPHCYETLSKPDLREGGIQNFIEAGKKLRGETPGRRLGSPWSDAYVHNTIESMCLGLMVDSRGDPEILAAQAAAKAKLDEWIPIVLAAQEPDGYLHTLYTVNSKPRWSNNGDHEGYAAGYFIEAAIAHYLSTGKKDARLYNAARKLADCWDANLGPAPKKAWYDGHEEMEQALVRLGRFVDAEEGRGKGQKYISLAKFLLDSRGGGSEYDQSQAPVTRQYEVVGHAVRAAYCYSGMADIVLETGDADYLSAVQSLWRNLVDSKYYITGGIGSGETSEGFGGLFSLPNNSAYCESCSSCGVLFFQHKLNLIHRDAKYADLIEDTLYNALLGDVDLPAENFTYTNPLDSSAARYKWHGCPCCVGNIPRVLLELPCWMYARDRSNLCVNLFIGSSTILDGVAGQNVRLTQTTDYPWNGKVAIKIEPEKAAAFALQIRVPARDASALYTAVPALGGIEGLSVNGKPARAKVKNGYAAINREWKPGDTVEFTLPMPVQRVRADARVTADAGRVALRYGPMVYNIESADQTLDLALPATAPLKTEWNPALLDGVVTIKGAFEDGSPMTAIPNYARLNRGGRSVVWIKEK